jgi:hypothetical protein
MFPLSVRLLLLAALAAESACTRAGPDLAAPAPDASSGCPLGVPGATVVMSDVENGATLAFDAPPQQTDHLRRRVRDAAKLYGPGTHLGMGHDGGHLGAHSHGLRLTELPPLYTRIDDTERGARLQLTAKVPEQTQELRDRMRARLAIVGYGPCD